MGVVLGLVLGPAARRRTGAAGASSVPSSAVARITSALISPTRHAERLTTATATTAAAPTGPGRRDCCRSQLPTAATAPGQAKR
jgi:hypothetical protein